MILIIGYGSQVRGDDGIGPILADALSQRLDDVDILIRIQLTPELAEPISAADQVYFIDADAATDERPGTVRLQTVVAAPDGAAFSHHVTPASLVSAARRLYGTAPEARLISIAGSSFDYGAELSPELRALLPQLIEMVQRLIEAPPQPMIGA